MICKLDPRQLKVGQIVEMNRSFKGRHILTEQVRVTIASETFVMLRPVAPKDVTYQIAFESVDQHLTAWEHVAERTGRGLHYFGSENTFWEVMKEATKKWSCQNSNH